ncbi:hypothetical protein CYLTODRAFT_485999 [Cylindrobasidium torrendii FP15055 ss-10]|uniref:Uncharacterized protein n=1 Tax=Cylindrobasidium torrendii FP15055 ss-10 TaxID=1314674 RepID=A0A0D7BT33_9AGAR|nr:hypothetical protein CYLTODRAFT_485999 [Cylindrobasidium torrendii FP15055 ss-10]
MFAYSTSGLRVFLGACVVQCVLAGQGFTKGLAIIDAPSAGSPGHAGSILSVAVEVSGNGAMPTDSAFKLLEVFLLSTESGINLTVASGASLIGGEEGSTVKHLNWVVPKCLDPGNYNLTFYETSIIKGEEYFIITPVSIPIINENPSGQCTGLNNLEAQPQVDSPPSDAPFGNASDFTDSDTPDDGSALETRSIPLLAIMLAGLLSCMAMVA